MNFVMYNRKLMFNVDKYELVVVERLMTNKWCLIKVNRRRIIRGVIG